MRSEPGLEKHLEFGKEGEILLEKVGAKPPGRCLGSVRRFSQGYTPVPRPCIHPGSPLTSAPVVELRHLFLPLLVLMEDGDELSVAEAAGQHDSFLFLLGKLSAGHWEGYKQKW